MNTPQTGQPLAGLNAMQHRHARRVCGRGAARRVEVLELYRAARGLMDHESHRRPRRGVVVFVWAPHWGRLDVSTFVALTELCNEIDADLELDYGEDGPVLTLTRGTGYR